LLFALEMNLGFSKITGLVLLILVLFSQ
jgi:hypothetical protein